MAIAKQPPHGRARSGRKVAPAASGRRSAVAAAAAPTQRTYLERVPADRLLRALPIASIDLLITDPPYTTVDRNGTSGAHLQTWFRGSMGWPEIGRTLQLAKSRLKPTGVALVMTNQAGLEAALHAMRAVRFIEPVRIITWDRQYPGLGGGLRHQTEYVLVGRLPASRPLSGVDLISAPAVGPGTADRYPTEKPEQLGRELARIVGIRRGDVVVDPFVGSGALLVGALERGAVVVGADISARAIERATERLRGPRAATRTARTAARPRKART